MKPAGLDNPRTGRWAYAIVQLRQENQRADSYNLVGFKTICGLAIRRESFV